MLFSNYRTTVKLVQKIEVDGMIKTVMLTNNNQVLMIYKLWTKLNKKV